MLASIQLDDQKGLDSRKVSDVTPDSDLTTPLPAPQLPVSQPSPQKPFNPGGLCSQPFGTLGQDGVSHHPSKNKDTALAPSGERVG